MSLALLIAALPLAAGPADGGVEDAASLPEVELVARLEPERVRLGERFELVVAVTRQAGQAIAAPERIDGDTVALLGPPSRSLAPSADGIRETLRFPMAAFAIDQARTPALALRRSDGEVLEVAPLPVQVTPSLGSDAAQTEPAEVAAPVAIERYDERPAAAAAVWAALALLLAALAWLERRRPLLVREADAGPPPEPPDRVALERLRQLEASELIRRGRFASFVARAVEILRWYLGERYQLAALDMTTTELHRALCQVLDPRLDQALVQRILLDADLVKFARAASTTQACARLLEDIRALVRATAPGPGAEREVA